MSKFGEQLDQSVNDRAKHDVEQQLKGKIDQSHAVDQYAHDGGHRLTDHAFNGAEEYRQTADQINTRIDDGANDGGGDNSDVLVPTTDQSIEKSRGQTAQRTLGQYDDHGTRRRVPEVIDQKR